MRTIYTVGLASSLVLVLLAIAMWATPAFAQVAGAVIEPGTLGAVGVGGSALNLLGLGVAAGKGQQQLKDHARRLKQLEALPGELAELKAGQTGLKAGQEALDTRLDDLREDIGKRIDGLRESL